MEALDAMSRLPSLRWIDRMDAAYEDKLDGTIGEETWRRKSHEWRSRQLEIQAAVERHLQACERRRELLLEERPGPRLGKRPPFDLQHRGKVRMVHWPQGKRFQAALLAFGKTTSSVLSR